MKTLELLQRRRSNKKLGQIAPNAEQLQHMFKAALRAPDHGKLKPYHFVVIEKQSMSMLKACLVDAAIEFEMDEKNALKADKIAEQAPLMIGIVAKIDHQSEKVPAWEQMISAGCATYAMQLAANALGFDTVWISNQWVEGKMLRQAFGCQTGDKIIGLLLVGSPKDASDDISLARETENTEGFVSYLQ
ncbi:nitroreductase family protein [[Haemophilus] ducreyi]|uniref:nitroreductase family protein n=1 Tax=Haemophilus ducreyi TaxID=730 RepID=UPI000655B264|nr:nitroreductase family protein [[Haemophilus] ducreyi]AKO45288.1 nitroreductase [[Haemophilus] ducreyi]AKO46690.1 nitroreductase [[Haemophilus] ducreyi]AKO48031.1 nitroreductase [[Haemophilus] ducreyi]AKO49418.1 nitroreductase [[Haemophilus] ducreyi]ANF61543.1 nitroreductase [[Haemophilus] ducreyi]